MTDISLQKLETELAQLDISDSKLELLRIVDSKAVYRFPVDSSQALAVWKQVHAIKDTTSYFPLIRVYPRIQDDSENLVRSEAELISSPVQKDKPLYSATEFIDQGLQLKAQDWFDLKVHTQQQEWEEYYLDDMWSEEEKFEIQKEKELLDPYSFGKVGEWNEQILPAEESIIIPTHRRTNTYGTVWVELIPTTMSWQVPAYSPFGNWNECPHLKVHICLMKYWYEQYGAEVVCIDHDVVEMIIKNPPTDREVAFKLAQQQYIYCPDIVDQGIGTLNNLAAKLLNGKTWYFWWD